MPLNLKTREVGLEQSIGQTVNKVNRKGISIKLRASDYTQPLGRITQKADEFNKSLEASNARVIAFGASAAIIGGVTQTFIQLVTQATKVEKILTDINVVLGTSLENLEKFGKDLFEVARNTSQGLEVAAEAALEFSRQGLSMEETLSRTNDALILTRLTGIGAAEAVSGLTAAVNGFADAGLTTTEIINKLAAVDVAFAVSAEDLINALARAGAVAQDAGVNFDQLVGAVTSAQQITARGGAVIGNSFKTIFTRVQRSSTLNALEELGVVVKDLSGNTLPAITVLTNLSNAYETLGDTTKAAVAEQVGGVFQINILKAALKDLTRENSLYAKATGISASATNEAQIKNQQLQETVQSLAAQTSLSIQELASNLGELSLAPGISNILDAVKSLSEGFNNLLGDDSEGIGADFAKGFVKGIGGVLTGPGVVLAIGVFAKLLKSAVKFGRDSLKDILQITTEKDKERKIQESILTAMSNNVNLYKSLNALSGDKKAQEDLIFKSIKAQTREMLEQERIAKTLAPLLKSRGVQPDLTLNRNNSSSKPSGGPSASSGFIPNYSSVTPMEREKERGGALKAGYAPGAVKDMDIKGIGRVIYNNKETVKQFPGMSQPAIMPPSSSRAGSNYKNKFEKQHGFNPYSSQGFIPNYIDRNKIETLSKRGATKGERDAASNKLKQLDSKKPKINLSLPKKSDRDFVSLYIEDKNASSYEQKSLHIDRLRKVSKYPEEKLKEISNARNHYLKNGKGSVIIDGQAVSKSEGLVPNFAANLIPGTNILQLPQAKMGVETTVSNYRGEKKTGLHQMEAPLQSISGKITSYQKELSALSEAGVGVLSRNIMFTDYDNPQTKKERKKSPGGLTQSFSEGKKGSPKPTSKQLGNKYEDELYSQKLKDAGYSKTSDQSKVDFIGKGLMPIEGKFNKIEQADLIAKSIRLYNDKSISNFLRKQGFVDKGQSLQRKNFDDSLLTLKQAGIDTESMSLKEQVKTVKDYNLHDGLIPNFTKLPFWYERYEKNKNSQEKDAYKLASDYNIARPHLSSIRNNQINPNTQSFFSNKKDSLLRNWNVQNSAQADIYRNHIKKQMDLAAAHTNLKTGINFPELYPKNKDKEFTNVSEMAKAYGVGQAGFERDLIKQKKSTDSKRISSLAAWKIIDQNADRKFDDILQQLKKAKENSEKAEDTTKVISSSQAGRLFEEIIIDETTGGKYGHSSKRIDIPYAQFSNTSTFGIEAGQYDRGDPIFQGLSGKSSGHFNFDKKIEAFIRTKEGGDQGGGQLKKDIVKHASTNISTGVKSQYMSGSGATKRGAFAGPTPKLPALTLNIADMIGGYRESFGGIKTQRAGKATVRRSKSEVDSGYDIAIDDLSVDKKFKTAYKRKTKAREITFPLKYKKDALQLPQSIVTKYQQSGDSKQKEKAAIIQKFGEELGFYKPIKSKKDSTLTSSIGFVPNFLVGGKLSGPSQQENKSDYDVARGFVPNFANPLQDAISRERSAGIPKSMIRIDQDNSLRSKENPGGLAVINTRDEPSGVKQGITRSKKMGIDPKKHGASLGFVPNFSEIPNDINSKLDLGVVSNGLIPNYASKNFLSNTTKSIGNKAKNLLSSGDKQFEKIWRTVSDKVSYLMDLGMNELDSIKFSKMNPKQIYKKIQKESISLDEVSIAQKVSQGYGSTGMIPNFANLTLYRGQNKSRPTIDQPTIGKNMPSFGGVKTPEDVVKIIQNFVKSHVSGPLSGSRDIGEIDNTAPSGATSFSTSETVAKQFAGGGLNKSEKGNILSKTVPEKNVFNKKKLLKILNKGADPKRGHYPKVEEFKKAMASGAIQKWAEQNGGIYLNVYGRRNDPSLLKHYRTEYGRKEYDFYDKQMNQIVPQSDIGRNPNGTNQISPREAEVMQVLNKGLIPKGTQNSRYKNQIQIRPNPAPFQPLELNKLSGFLARYNREKGDVTLKTKLTGEPGLKITKRNQSDWRQFMNHALFGNLAQQNLSAASKAKYQIQKGPDGKEAVRGFTQGIDLPNDDVRLPAAASLGLIPNFMYNKRPMALFGSDYPQNTNGSAYTGKTIKNKKPFLTEKGFQIFKSFMEEQKKPISGINSGRFQNKNVYWLNTPKAQEEVKSWGLQPNTFAISQNEKKKEDLESRNKKYLDEIKNGVFKPTSSIKQVMNFTDGSSLDFEPMKQSLSKKLGDNYKYISYNEKNIRDYAQSNGIIKNSIGGTTQPDMQSAIKKIIKLSPQSIAALNVFKPREKTESEKKVDTENSKENQIKWHKDQGSDGKNKWSIKASPEGLKKFKKYLIEKGVSPSAIKSLDSAHQYRQNLNSEALNKYQKTKKQLGQSRQKRNAGLSFDSAMKDSNKISTQKINIPNLSNLIKDYNQNYANIGFVPNFASKNFQQPGQQVPEVSQLSNASNSKNFSAPGSKTSGNSSFGGPSDSKNFFESGSIIPEPKVLDSGTLFSQSEIKKVLLEYDLDSLDQGIMELQSQNIKVPTNIIREVYDRKEKQSAFSGQRKKINSLGSSDEALNQAINREVAAGVPRSQIRIEQDNSLRSSQNSKGLAVTNLKDEPGGIKQGIARSKNMGIDPKTHGASVGFVPNYNFPFDENYTKRVKDNDFIGGRQGGSAQGDGGSSKKSVDKVDKASEGLSMRLIGLTTVTYALESAFADMEGSTGSAIRTLNGIVQAGSQAGLAFDALKGMGDGVNKFIGESKIGKAASATMAAGEGASLFSKKGAMGGIAKGFLNIGQALPIVGAGLAMLGPVMDLLKEHTKSAAEQMAKSLSEASSQADAFSASLSAAESLSQTNNKLLELNNSSQAGTYEGRIQEIQLLGQQAKQQLALTEQVKSLGETAGLTEEDIVLMTSGSAEGLQKLREASLSAQQALVGLQQVKTWADSLRTESSFFGLVGEDKKEDPIMKKLAETNMARSFSRSAGGDGEKALDQIKRLESLILSVNPNINSKALESFNQEAPTWASRFEGYESSNSKNRPPSRGINMNSGFSVGSAFMATANLEKQRNDVTRALAKEKGIGLEKDFFGQVDYAATRNKNPELSRSIVDSNIASPRNLKGGTKSIKEVSQAIADDEGFSDEIKGQAKGILDALEKGVDPKEIGELFKNLKDSVLDYTAEQKKIADDAALLARVQARTLALENDVARSYEKRLKSSDLLNSHFLEMAKLTDNLSSAYHDYGAHLGGISNVSGVLLKQTRERVAQERNMNSEERAIRRKAIDELKKKTTTLLDDKGTTLGKQFLKDPTAEGGGGVDTDSLIQKLDATGFTETELDVVRSKFAELAGNMNDPISAAGAMGVIVNSLNNRLLSLLDQGDMEGMKTLIEGFVGGGTGSILNSNSQGAKNVADGVNDIVDSYSEETKYQNERNSLSKKILNQTQALELLKAGEVKATEKAMQFLDETASTIQRNAIANQQASNRTQAYLLKKQMIETDGLTNGEGLLALIDAEVITRQAALDLEKRRNVGLLGLIDNEEKLSGIVASEVANKIGSRASTVRKAIGTNTQMAKTITAQDAENDPQLSGFIGQTGYEAMAGLKTQELTGEMDLLKNQYSANAAAGVYQQEALNDMTKSTIDFKIAMDKIKTKLDKGGFAIDEVQSIKLNREQLKGRGQAASAGKSFYEGEGNTLKAAEKQVELAKITQERNIELYGKEALFRDTLSVRIAENNLAIEKFSQTLANTSFDAVQDGFKQMARDIGDSTMRMQDVFLKFAGSIVQKIHDKLIERASMQLTSGIFSALGFGSDTSTGGTVQGVGGAYKGGIIRRNIGGSVGYSNNKKVPTMLTSGEYVVRKKIVDRLGTGKLEKMNETGSLEDIYKMNTGGSVSLSSSGGAPSPVVKLNAGGIASALKRAMGGLVFANDGGWMKDKWNQAKSWTNDNILNPSSNSTSMNIARGAGYLAGTSYAAYENRQNQPYAGPTAPVDPGSKNLNFGASLNVNPSGGQMSARFRANNDYSKQYGNYLLNKYQYDVDQQNQKVKARHSQWAGLAGGLAAGVGFKAASDVFSSAKNAWDMRGGVGANLKGMFTKDVAKKAEYRKTGAQADVARMQKNGINDYASWKAKSPGTFGMMNKALAKTDASKNYEALYGKALTGDTFIQAENDKMAAAMSMSKAIQTNLNTSNSLLANMNNSKNYGGSSSFNPFSANRVGGGNANAYNKSNIYEKTIQDRFGDKYGQPIKSSSFGTSSYGGGQCTGTQCPMAFSQGGKVIGRGGIDKIGPIMLDQGEYVVKADSVSKIEKNNPGFFDRLNSMNMMNQGGIVKAPSSPTPEASNTGGNGGGGGGGSVTVNINVSSSGDTTMSGGGDSDQAMASRIKDAVVGVISQEKRTGGSLNGY